MTILETYRKLKEQNPDVVLFIRLGDFYEAFEGDARTVADVCEIVLCTRPFGKDVRVPMAGVPYFSVESYVKKLLEAGHRVGLVDREVEVREKTK